MIKLIKMILYWSTYGTEAGIGPHGGVRTKDSYKLWLRILCVEQIISERQIDYSGGYDLKILRANFTFLLLVTQARVARAFRSRNIIF